MRKMVDSAVCLGKLRPQTDTEVHALINALLDSFAARVADKLSARDGLDASTRWAKAKDNPLGSERTFLDAARRGDFPTFKAGRVIVSRWADVESFIESRACKRLPSAPKHDAAAEERAELAAAGVRLRPAKGAAR